MDELPDNVLQIDALRITRAVGKRCKCKRRYKRFTVDPDNREVTCSDCGAVVDAFTAMLNVAEGLTEAGRQLKAVLAQKRELEEWKPHLVAIKQLNDHFTHQHSRGMLPCCPHCGRGIEYLELGAGTWVSRDYERLVRAKEKSGGPDDR